MKDFSGSDMGLVEIKFRSLARINKISARINSLTITISDYRRIVFLATCVSFPLFDLAFFVLRISGLLAHKMYLSTIKH
jgi:hypothetical protein